MTMRKSAGMKQTAAKLHLALSILLMLVFQRSKYSNRAPQKIRQIRRAVHIAAHRRA